MGSILGSPNYLGKLSTGCMLQFGVHGTLKGSCRVIEDCIT